jgi:hypothetical protein
MACLPGTGRTQSSSPTTAAPRNTASSSQQRSKSAPSACGVIREWPADGPSPTVVNGVLVVEKDGKQRMCINPMYANAKLRHRGVKYERLSDVCDYLTPEDWLYTTDDKIGYWQLPLHPSEWTHFTMCTTGRTFPSFPPIHHAKTGGVPPVAGAAWACVCRS